MYDEKTGEITSPMDTNIRWIGKRDKELHLDGEDENALTNWTKDKGKRTTNQMQRFSNHKSKTR